MTTLQQIGWYILALIAACGMIYFKFRQQKYIADQREQKSGLQGLFKKID